ncbi:MAG: glycoside-pentoside-hexuronide (GPH):cation symporter [Lachnospiraceae bacterium]|nr:glycoside-pentoside-hexuronide (GPH):cation symporter [Lachnospiraceae bacterium]
MEQKRKLTTAEKASYGIGAVGKDMMYMLSASWVFYYFQDIMGASAIVLGIISMVARVFDAFNDPIMGVIVAKTKTKWGKFRPWLLIGTITNAIVLVVMFSAPPTLDAAGLAVYAAVTYILWGVTYTMMDIPYWSMIPAFTEGGKEREGLTTLARSCAGVGSALVSIFTVMVVAALGNKFAPAGSNAYEIERVGFKYAAWIVAILFVVCIVITCINVKEKSSVEMKTASVGDMFKALVANDQAMTVVITIVLINTALYVTSNLVIYFFKYDLGGTSWKGNYTLFNTVGGGVQILAMMLLYPALRKLFNLNNIKIFTHGICASIVGYLILLGMATAGLNTLPPFLLPGVIIMAVAGVNNVVVTVFLANTVDYGEWKNGHREESVIFSMQTFVVKLSSGIAILVTSIALQIFKLSKDTGAAAEANMDLSAGVDMATKVGLRMIMTLIPIACLAVAYVLFKKKYILTDEKIEEISAEIAEKKTAAN